MSVKLVVTANQKSLRANFCVAKLIMTAESIFLYKKVESMSLGTIDGQNSSL
jgi:hypothetical protein